ncbi:MAG: UDP-2,4-diacetamido-2,4,6-trideoxy-beta-L-altropyranose hydrolase [Prolixibacteraceae bacterium]|nr:UDP-2,4-diacetamido-2,4,6-trideoxy-beta-L-altropyranose hydrolase [Prolixibacteraceae bacterium]
MNKCTIIFRADGGSDIGMGHFIRTLSLAEMLKDNFYCIFATRKPTEYQIEEIKKTCDKRIDLPEDDSHFKIFLNYLKGDEIVVLDNYYYSTEYQRQIKDKGCKLVCIDDLHDKHYIADIVINYTITDKKLFSTEPYTKLLTGFSYALLRKEFLQSKSERKIKEKFKHVFICIGGSDFNNLTCKFLDDLNKIDQIKEITIVTGNAYNYTHLLTEKVNKYSCKKAIKLYHNITAGELITEMDKADFGIVPCSTVLFETISRKLPVIIGFYVDNQKENALNLQDKFKQILVTGDLNKKHILFNDIKKLEENMLRDSCSVPLISEKISENFLKEFKILENEFSISVKEARNNDIDIYFKWANDREVRNNSINSNLIKYNEHINWFSKKIYEKNSFLYIFKKRDIPLGQVRFEKDIKDNFFIINYSVDTNYRGLGFGRTIVRMGIEKLLKDYDLSGELKLRAIVKEKNIASVKVFKALDFISKGIKPIDKINCFIFEK